MQLVSRSRNVLERRPSLSPEVGRRCGARTCTAAPERAALQGDLKADTSRTAVEAARLGHQLKDFLEQVADAQRELRTIDALRRRANFKRRSSNSPRCVHFNQASSGHHITDARDCGSAA